MFALWYLSLAVDELRKHFGWTFFDIFYKKSSTANTNALDNTPATATTPKPAESSQPKPTAPTVTVKSLPTPAPTPAPVVKPVTPSTPKPAPVIEPAKPAAVVELPKPAAVVEPPKPAALVEPPKPSTATKPETVVKPPHAPTPPFNSVDQTPGQNGSLKDATDKMLFGASKAKENGGENLKNRLKTTTSDFLSGEAMAQAPIKMNKFMAER